MHLFALTLPILFCQPAMNDDFLYRESLRPQFHFTARHWQERIIEPGQRQEGWINDLNGLIYYEGEWHLFAQRWAKCWLHAVSKDLIHWEELQPAFWEESEGSGVQSGTCVIDYENTSGLGKDPKHPPMVAFWSRFDNHSQCISFSLDRGRTWERYKGNPIFDKPERDPKVFWHKPTKRWVMVMYGDGAYHILTSSNLLKWVPTGNTVPNSFECPDFFEMPIDGDPKRTKWVLIQGNGNYSIGEFDGRKFVEEGERHSCDVGPNFYATQSWHNTDTGDGRRIQVAWMRSDKFPGMPFNQQISFPCELSLKSTKQGLRIFREPIKELKKLEGKAVRIPAQTLEAGKSLTVTTAGDLYRIRMEVDIPSGATLTLNLRGNEVKLTRRTVENGHQPSPVQDKVNHVDILLDRASIECYLNHGELSSTRTCFPRAEGLSMSVEGGSVKVKSLVIIPLKSIWR